MKWLTVPRDEWRSLTRDERADRLFAWGRVCGGGSFGIRPEPWLQWAMRKLRKWLQNDRPLLRRSRHGWPPGSGIEWPPPPSPTPPPFNGPIGPTSTRPEVPHNVAGEDPLAKLREGR